MTRAGAVALVLVMGLVACQPITSPTTSVSGGTTTPGPVTTPTSDSPRALETVDCDDPPADVAIVCESYEIIVDNYVDPVTAEELAASANEGLEELEELAETTPLVCAAPAEQFETTCATAADAGLGTAETAEAIVSAMVSRALDPNSSYFDPEALALIDAEDEGQIEGIGALVSPEDQTIPGDDKQCAVISSTCRLLIVSTIEGAPASLAGLRRDDVMVGVDGESIAGWTIDEVTARVRGRAGTRVTLTIERDGETIDIPMVRAAVEIPVIDSEQVGDTGYIRLHVFSDVADEQFEDAVAGLLADGVGHLVIDLRDNPGGLLDTAVEIASVFMEEGDVVVTEGPDEHLDYPVTGDALVPDDIEVDFVVNKGSASASELVSAVLQETGRAKVIGENTFGKNTVQQRFSLSNGGALRLTIARWLTPGGLDFGGVGVTPDVPLPLEPDLDAAEVVAAVLAAT